MLDEFTGFSQIQVIDLDAALGHGSNDTAMRALCMRAARDRVAIRAGGGVRSVERAMELAAAGADKIIVGTAAFSEDGLRHDFLRALADALGRDHLMVALDSREGHIVVKGWQQSTHLTAEEVVQQLEPYCTEVLCTFVDREGTMTGTDLDWFARLRAATTLAITAAGGIHTLEEIHALDKLGINAALGMAVYTGKLSLDVLRTCNGGLQGRASQE
jgi:phosphoribosylformimino-5-aminoimidazole carboxamide ribonucleotide (ProFAR) isomerase